MTTYTITVTEAQARLIAQAMDLVSRIQVGQWHEFIDWLPPTKEFCRHSLHEQLLPVMSEHFRKTKPEGCQYAIDGCGVAALQNTRDSAAQRGAPGDYGYSGSYEEVCRAVDREMALREQRDELLDILQRLKAVDFGEHWNSEAEQAAISARELIRKFEVESGE